MRSGKMKDMAVSGRIRQRLALAIVFTALIPVLVAIWYAETTVRQAAARFYMPDIGVHLNRSLGLYQELARTVKSQMRYESIAIAQNEALRRAVREGDRARIERELRRLFAEHPSLVSLVARDSEGRELGKVIRDQPLDPARERDFPVEPPLSDGPEGTVPTLQAIFAASRARFDELSEMSVFVDTYGQVERRRESDERGYVLGFALLLCITIVAAVGVGSLMARGVSGRIAELAEATKLVAAGNLAIRVPERGNDEMSELARAFNRMLGEVAESRARIEYLQRIGAWQEMARRLAHEIKNPLTPIQLAVQEAHRRYDGADPKFTKLLDTTLEIVEDEVGTLRRLVGEFSDFARLPQANLEQEDLAEFLRELSAQLVLVGDERGSGELPDELRSVWEGNPIDLVFKVPSEPAQVLMDRHMLRRVLVNLLQNAAQALRRSSGGPSKIRVTLRRDGDYWLLDIDDSGPGIPEALRETVFDPYVTTKHDGTGLGLAIVKKIVIEHGGSIGAGDADLGGARLRVRFPALGTQAAAIAQSALLQRSDTRLLLSDGAP